MAHSADPAGQAEEIVQVVYELGLQPYTPPEPFPEINLADVHVIFWLAVG